MVAVPRSNGCLTCRSRRIKCDEGVPVCKRCRDSRRDCAYRNKFTFVDGGSKRRSPDADSGGVERNGSRSMHNSVWLYTTERRTDSGSLFQKWHRSDALPALASEPAMTEKERQASKLIKCFHEGRAGARLDQLGKWLLLVPQRLGVSQALDDAAVLLSSVHSAMLRRPDLDSSMWVDTAPYLQAVTSLREAVADPIKGFSVETLAATFTLYYIEAVLGSPYQWNFIFHAGGAARLLELRGPGNHQDGFEQVMAVHLRGPIVARAVMLGVPCYLASPLWQNFFDSFRPETESGVLLQKLGHELMTWSDFACQVRALWSIPQSERETLFQELYHTKVQLDLFEPVIEGMLGCEKHATLVKAVRPGSLFKHVFHFPEYSTQNILQLHASLSLIINRMIHVVGQALVQDASLKIADSTDQHNDMLVRRICQSYEFAWKRRPIGVQSMSLPLTMAFMHAKTETTREWLLQAMDDMDEHRKLAKSRFTAFDVDLVAKMYTGEAPALVIPSGA